MELTPKKTISLRSTPKGKLISADTQLTPKKVRFSIDQDSKLDVYNGKENRVYKAEDVLCMLNDSSLSDDETSSDEEWIVTKSKALSISDSPALKRNDLNLRNKSTPLKNAVVKVSPLKLLRKAEYEVNKVPSTVKKTEPSVSPIVIKRKTDTRHNTDAVSLPLTPSSKLNKQVARYDSDTENECSPPKRKTVDAVNINSAICIDSEDNKSLADRIKLTTRKCASSPNKNAVVPKISARKKIDSSLSAHSEVLPDNSLKRTPRSSARKKLELPSLKIAEVVLDLVPNSPNVTTQPHTPRRSVRKKLALSSPNPEVLTPRRSARKKLELDSPSLNKKYIEEDSSDDNLEDIKTQRRKNKVTSDVIPDSPELTRKVLTPRTSARKKLELDSPSRKKKYIEEDSSSDDNSEDIRTPKRKNKKYIEEDSSSEDQSEQLKTPKRKNNVFRHSVADSPCLRRQVLTPRHSTKKLELSSPGITKKIGSGFLSPVVQERTRSNLSGTPTTLLDLTRSNLHTSNIPTSLPCREKEFTNVLTFTMRKIEDKAGGCMYISGVPGTGKTATVHAVIKLLQEKAEHEELSKFNFIEINGLRLTEPRQAYTRLWQELSGNKCSPEMAMTELEKKFNKKCKQSTLILVDELDYLCNRRQDVIYNILEWSTKSTAALTVITIANTMDLPERTLKGKVTSRMGLTRLVFQPYTFQQLQEIVLNRIGSNSNFHVDAVQLVARKVAAVSGDARRALDICRRATELISSDSEVVKVSHIEKALTQIFAGTRVQAIKKCSVMNQFLLRAMKDEYHRTGVEETSIGQVYSQFSAITTLEGYEVPPIGLLLNMSSLLSDSGLILAEKCRSDINRKLSLNVSPDDIHYALSC